MRNPRRTATTAAALMIGVGLVSAISIFAASTTETVDKIIDDTVVGDLVVDSGSQGFGGLSPALAEDVNALPEVALASGVRALLAEIDGEGEPMLAFETVDMDDLVDVGIVAGDPATLGVDGLAVLDTEAEARGWELGSEVTITFVNSGAQPFTVGLIYTEDSLVGPLFISTEAHEANSTEVFDMSVYVLAAEGVPTDEFRSAVETVTAPYPNAEVMDLGELKDSISAQVDQMLTLVYALLALAVIIALIGIANTIALSTVERTREIGLLRAVGMTRSQLRASVRWESFLIAVLGTTMGLALGLFFGWAMVEALRDEGITELAIPLPQIIVVAILAAAAGVFASLRPAAKAARLPILDAVVSGN
jgi:putative ABC transport system permease protein